MYGSKQGWSLSTYPIHAVQKTTTALKNALFLSVNVFNTKIQIRDTIFYGTATLRAHPSHAKVYPCRAKAVPSFLSYFKTLSIGPAPGIEPGTFLSAVERSPDLANPAAKFWFVDKMQGN